MSPRADGLACESVAADTVLTSRLKIATAVLPVLLPRGLGFLDEDAQGFFFGVWRHRASSGGSLVAADCSADRESGVPLSALVYPYLAHALMSARFSCINKQ